MVTWQLFGFPHFLPPQLGSTSELFSKWQLVFILLGFWRTQEKRKINSVVRHMENHMLLKTAYVMCLRCKDRYAKINTCQLHYLPRLENSKSLCSYAKNTACLKFHRLLKLKQLIQVLQIPIPMGHRKVIQRNEVGQVGPCELGGGGAP